MSSYSHLNRAQLSFDYLHANSTTHEFLFGALAEIVDNSRDAGATQLDIFIEHNKQLRGEFMLCFLDNGVGMDPDEVVDVITFGRSTKKEVDLDHIGMYGNGLKSGSMRIGNDLILFTKKAGVLTCLFLSRTFHEEENITEVIVPIPSFKANGTDTHTPFINATSTPERHETELQLILKYSPFHTMDSLMSQFAKIKSDSGTLVVIYNMKLMDNGDPELDTKTDPRDILLANWESETDLSSGLHPELRSFRAYTSILYKNPRMKIYIQSKKVRTKRLETTLFKPKVYKYSSNRFRERAKRDAERAKDESKRFEMKAKEADSKSASIEKKIGGNPTKQQNMELRKARKVATNLRQQADDMRQFSEKKLKSLKTPKELHFYFGVNINDRRHDGLFIYNSGRLIKMYEKAPSQASVGVYLQGIVGVVDVPYLVLEPTHNKQDFADATEFRHLKKAMDSHMQQYWKDIDIAEKGVSEFWKDYGYETRSWTALPKQDLIYLKKRAMRVQTCIQCDKCLKWRIIPFAAKNVTNNFKDDWTCDDNIDDRPHSMCSAPEQKPDFQEGVYRKEEKSKEDKQQALKEDIEKRQKELHRLDTQVTSSKDIRIRQNGDDIGRTTRAKKLSREGKHLRLFSRDSDSSDEEPVAAKKVRGPMSPSSDGVFDQALSGISPVRAKQAFTRPPITVTRKSLSPGSASTKTKPVPMSTTRRDMRQQPTRRELTARGGKVAASARGVMTEHVAKRNDSPAKGKPDYKVSAKDIGSRVEVKGADGKWLKGNVVEVDDVKGWKIKLDAFPASSCDRWLKKSSGNLRMEKPVPIESVSSLCRHLRDIIRFCLPPSWNMTKEQIDSLHLDDLVKFDMTNFLDCYEQSVRDLIKKHQEQSDRSQNQLKAVRKTVVDIMNTLSETPISVDVESNEVDSMAQHFLEQLQSAEQDG